MTAPTHHQTGPEAGHEHAGIAQDLEHRVGDAARRREVELHPPFQLVGDVENVAQHREQVLAHAADHLAADEGPVRCIAQVEPQTAVLLHQAEVEIPVALEQIPHVVDLRPARQHCQCAASEQIMKRLVATPAQGVDLALGEDGETGVRRHCGVGNDAAGIENGMWSVRHERSVLSVNS